MLNLEISQAGLKIAIFPPQPPECWDVRGVAPGVCHHASSNPGGHPHSGGLHCPASQLRRATPRRASPSCTILSSRALFGLMGAQVGSRPQVEPGYRGGWRARRSHTRVGDQDVYAAQLWPLGKGRPPLTLDADGLGTPAASWRRKEVTGTGWLFSPEVSRSRPRGYARAVGRMGGAEGTKGTWESCRPEARPALRLPRPRSPTLCRVQDQEGALVVLRGRELDCGRETGEKGGGRRGA